MATTELQENTNQQIQISEEDQPLSAGQQPTTTFPATPKPKQKSNLILYGFIILTIICLGLLIITIYYATSTHNDSSSSTPDSAIISPSPSPTISNNDTDDSNICITEECVELSATILSWMNTGIDPCDNFFQYACGGFQEEYRYQLSKYPQWTTEWSNVNVMGEERRNKFLEFLYDDEDPLHERPSIISIKTFYESCYESTMEQEEIATTQLLKDFINVVNFTSGDFDDVVWDSESAQGFQDALSWLSLRDWNDLFTIGVIEQGMVSMLQAYWIWDYFNATKWNIEMEQVYIPLYQTYFGLNLSEAEFIASEVVDFMSKIADVSNPKDYYYDSDTLNDYLLEVNISSFEDLNSFFSYSNNIMNYTNILLGTFNVEQISDLQQIGYIANDEIYYSNLSQLIADTEPYIIQYWLFTDILYHYFDINYESAFEQPRSETRRQFCYVLTRSSFSFLYAHIFISRQYSEDAQATAQDLVTDIIDNGLMYLLENAEWIDDQSRAQMIKKGVNMLTYIGIPDTLRNITLMDTFYGALDFDADDNFVNNYEKMINFGNDYKINLFSAKKYDFDFVGDWPSIFNDPGLAPYWLTGISAFYFPYTYAGFRGNYFCIPALITSPPFFSEDGPSAMNYGGIGFVIGHEISHGFDPSGSLFDYQGVYNDTWSNQTRYRYNKRVKCYVDFYDGIEVNDGIFVDGLAAITENTADNAGLEEAWTAYKTSPNRVSNDKWDNVILPGFPTSESDTVESFHDKLFWISMAQTRCDVWRDDYYSNIGAPSPSYAPTYYITHSPRIARVLGVVPNQDGFAEAFQCTQDSPMNPTDKCHLWID